MMTSTYVVIQYGALIWTGIACNVAITESNMTGLLDTAPRNSPILVCSMTDVSHTVLTKASLSKTTQFMSTLPGETLRLQTASSGS